MRHVGIHFVGKMAEQYDVSPEFRKLFERKQQQRMEFRAHYLKNLLNPYRHMTQEGGHIVSYNFYADFHYFRIGDSLSSDFFCLLYEYLLLNVFSIKRVFINDVF